MMRTTKTLMVAVPFLAICLVGHFAHADRARVMCKNWDAILATKILGASAIVRATVVQSKSVRKTQADGRWSYEWKVKIAVKGVLMGKHRLGNASFSGGCSGLRNTSMNHCRRPPQKSTKQIVFFLHKDKKGKFHLLSGQPGFYGNCPGRAVVKKANKRYPGLLAKIKKLTP